MVWATMSTAPDWISGIRCASEMARNSILPGLPIALATADHVDVESLDLPVQGVEVAEVVGALVHAGDQVAAGADPGHERARRGPGRAGRAQARRGVAGRAGGRGCWCRGAVSAR